MPTHYPRVSVTKDPELSHALERARGALGDDIKEARLIRDLAVKGAQALVDEEVGRRDALERLADPDRGGLDLEVLARVEGSGMEELPEPFGQ